MALEDAAVAINLAEEVLTKALDGAKPLTDAQRKRLEANRKRRKAEAAEELRDFEASPEGRRLDAELDAEVAADERRLIEAQTRARAPMLGMLEDSLRSNVPEKPAGSPSTVRVGDEPLVYGTGSDFSYFRDRFSDVMAQTPAPPPRGGDHTPRAVRERLQRHQQQMQHLATRGTDAERALIMSYFTERNRPFHGTPMDRSRQDFRDLAFFERRDVTTGSGSMGDFAPPVYVLERWQMYRTASSPVASQAGQAPLPATGMTVDIPQITGVGVAMGVQASENTNVSNSSPTATQTGTPVLTAAGVVEISQQTLDRFGPGVRADQVIAEQAARQAATAIDTQAIDALFTSPLAVITNSNSPGIEALWADVTKAGADIAGSEGTRLSATHVMMPSANAKWFQSLLDSEGRPIWSPSPASGLARAGQVNTRSEGYQGYDLAGYQVFEDNNIPTSGGYAQILVADLPNGLLVMTGAPIVDVFPEFSPTTLTCAISIRQFFACVVLYENSAVQIGGAAYPIAPTWTGG
jgi:HK97 family phage major capsid protein